MGGTFQRLHEQGHDVHVGYQTSGNIAVTDEFVTRFLDFAVGFEEIAGIDTSKSGKIMADARKFLDHKKSNQVDKPSIRAIKGLIRRCEASATCRYVGIKEENVHFLNLPFYETGTIEKKPISEKDIQDWNGFDAESKTSSGLLCWRFCRSAWDAYCMFSGRIGRTKKIEGCR